MKKLKKLSIGLLDELAKNQQKLCELEMKSIVGGGSGTPDDPYTITEMESLMDSFQWRGGYVEYFGYVSFSTFEYESYYGGFCNQYTGTLAEQIESLISSGWEQVAATIIGSIPYLSVSLSYMINEIEDCKTQMFVDITELNLGNIQIDFVATPGNYSSDTTNWSTIMSAYDAVTGELLVSYKINTFGFYEKIK